MGRYGQWWGVWVGRYGQWWGGWAARFGLNPLLGLVWLAMKPRSASHTLNMFRGPRRYLTTTGVNFRPMPYIYCPPWALMSQSWIYMVGKTHSRKADQSEMVGNHTENGNYMSVSINWVTKIKYAWCDNLVGFQYPDTYYQ